MDDDVLLADGGKTVAVHFADALGETRNIGFEFQVRPVDRHDLRQVVQGKHAVDRGDMREFGNDFIADEIAQVVGRVGIDLETDDRTAAAAFQCRFKGPHNILGLFLDLDIGVANDAEIARTDHLVAGEQLADEQRDDLLDGDENGLAILARRQFDEAADA